MVLAPFGKTVTLIRRVADGYDRDTGATRYAESRTEVPNSVVVPGSSVEDERGLSDTATQSLTWYCPAGVSPTVTDEAEVDGLRYRVNGIPADYGVHSITGRTGRTVVALSRGT